jgi:formylglycine-generating enzyme required for sulfatase activity
MGPNFVIALLLCRFDNCDLVKLEPSIAYPSYEACQVATAAKLGHLGDVARQYREPDREGQMICLREVMSIAEVESEYMAVGSVPIHDLPTATSKRVGVVAPTQHVRVTGIVGDTGWLRVAMEDGATGYAFGERLRKVALPSAQTSANPAATATPPPRETPSRQPESPEQVAAPLAMPPKSSPGPARQGEFQDCERCPIMVKVPGGTYIMGSNGDSTEQPRHSVTIAPFAVGKFEATEAEWVACATGGGCGYKPGAAAGSPERPMANLSWDDANEYVRWLATATGKPYRLLTEAEWEYAARAGTETRYPWGGDIGVAKANCIGCGGTYDPARPADIAQFAPNPWDLYGMLGGVAEWTDDCWHHNYTGAPANGSAWLGSPCSTRVVRGGSWKNPPSDLTVSSRNFYDSSVRYIANGLRVALSMR